MNSKEEQLQAISEMRIMMERSSRFLSLSGLAGVIVGLYAIIGILFAYFILDRSLLDPVDYNILLNSEGGLAMQKFLPLLLDSLVVLFISIITGSIFAIRNARKKQYIVWDATSKRLLINMMVPLLTGAIYCFILLSKMQIAFIAPATLIFYGLALFTASRYTIDDVRNLGVLQIMLGLVACYYMQYGLIFWAVGFGLLHIVYGLFIYNKYEK